MICKLFSLSFFGTCFVLIFNYIYLLRWVHGWLCDTAKVWSSEDTFQESVLFLHQVGPRNPCQVLRLDSKWLYSGTVSLALELTRKVFICPCKWAQGILSRLAWLCSFSWKQRVTNMCEDALWSLIWTPFGSAMATDIPSVKCTRNLCVVPCDFRWLLL